MPHSITKNPDELIWNQRFKSKDSLKNYLSHRIVELTDELKDQPLKLEQTGACSRLKWIAQLIYHAWGVIVFSLGKLIGKMCRSDKLRHRCQIKFFNHGTKLYSRAKALECSKELLVKSHNGFNLSRSKVVLRRDINYNGKRFDMSTIKGNCLGTCYLFTLLYLKGKKKFPNLTDREILLKIAHLMRHGALPEASIVQLMPSEDLRDHLASFYPEVEQHLKIRPEKRHLERIDITKDEPKTERITKLKSLKSGVPYQLTTRTGITGGLHATLLFRTGEAEFFWYDSCRGLTAFQGEKGMKKLLNLWDYGKQQKCEKSDLNRVQKLVDNTTVDFNKRHNLNGNQVGLLTNIETQIKTGKSWEQIEKIAGVEPQKNLVRHYFETHRENINIQNDFKYHFGRAKGVFLTPMLHSIVGRNNHHDQNVMCHYWRENRVDQPLECPLLGI